MNIESIIQEAKEVAILAHDNYVRDNLGGQDRLMCGFAWVNIYAHNGVKIRANSKLGKALAEQGIEKSVYHKCFQLWNPSGSYMQNVDCKYAAAIAYAEVLKKHGFEAVAESRLD